MVTSRLPDGRVPVVLSAHDENLIATDAHAVLDYLDRTPCEVAQVGAQCGWRRQPPGRTFF